MGQPLRLASLSDRRVHFDDPFVRPLLYGRYPRDTIVLNQNLVAAGQNAGQPWLWNSIARTVTELFARRIVPAPRGAARSAARPCEFPPRARRLRPQQHPHLMLM